MTVIILNTIMQPALKGLFAKLIKFANLLRRDWQINKPMGFDVTSFTCLAKRLLKRRNSKPI